MTIPRYSDAQRMELRAMIRLASEVIGQYWPMRTFVHHNPLHGLECRPFDEAVELGQAVLGGSGYLPGERYRAYVRSGRIRLEHLDEALKPLVQDKHVVLGARRISHREVLRACLTHGLCTEELLETWLGEDADQDELEALAHHLAPAWPVPSLGDRLKATVQEDLAALGRRVTLAQWCDRVLGTAIGEQVNRELMKWCEAFLDEGHATWPMPGREKGFYEAWRALARYEWSPCGLTDSFRKIAQLPDHPEDVVLDALARLGIPESLRHDYLALELAQLPGWVGFIKWRAEQEHYPWQEAYPIDLVQFLAVRLWYVCELVQQVCWESLGIEGQYPALARFMRDHPEAYVLRKERVVGHLPASYAEAVDQLCALEKRAGPARRETCQDAWRTLASRYQRECGPRRERVIRRRQARRLRLLADALGIEPALLMQALPSDLAVLLAWMEAFPESAQGPVWLKAFEAGYQEQLLSELARNVSRHTGHRCADHGTSSAPAGRPQSQSVFCLDVRSEPFRRHLEAIGFHETYGFAGFFGVFIRFRAWGKPHDTDQYPVIMRAKNEVRELPRSYVEPVVAKHETRVRLVQAGHTLLHELKENVVAPYVMVESLGWFHSLPLIGKTLAPLLYRRWTTWLRRLLVPPLATCLTVDKLAPADVDEMLAAEQRALIWRALRDQLGLHGVQAAPDLVEALRRLALDGADVAEVREPVLREVARRAGLSEERLAAFVGELRRCYRIDRRWAAAKKERVTRTGFTLDEQVLTVDTALRMIGLTKQLARLVLFCAHGSTSENNPFEAALDCGACGGNEGGPNARVLAAMANNPLVRERLAVNGLVIPSDTYFLAGQVDTTTDVVQLFDLEDVPATHARDVACLLEDLREAGRLAARERCARLPDAPATGSLDRATKHVRRRSADWSQVRPEWGLAGNAAFIIARRAVTKGLDLGGRVFLHSYDFREDPAGRLLEVLLTGPQIIAQWINLEHYFSTVDNECYGAGSKVYHTVVGRLGVMWGERSDLRLGLASQTVLNGAEPYHEPMRLLTVVEAPRARVESVIARHQVLKHLYHGQWVHLVVLESDRGAWYRYLPTGEWLALDLAEGSSPRSGPQEEKTWGI